MLKRDTGSSIRVFAMRRAAALVVLIALAVAGCGGSDESGEEESERATVECEGASVMPDLPADFPEVAGVTFTKSTTSGPTKVADGYYEGSLEDAYDKFKSAFPEAGYDVTFDEIEEDDSEVAYKGGDENRTGIVALRKNCKQDGRISVHITSRPA
jgi:ABC-type glycerol-3-phosphate transport system substrate-binding protein